MALVALTGVEPVFAGFSRFLQVAETANARSAIFAGISLGLYKTCTREDLAQTVFNVAGVDQGCPLRGPQAFPGTTGFNTTMRCPLPLTGWRIPRSEGHAIELALSVTISNSEPHLSAISSRRHRRRLSLAIERSLRAGYRSPAAAPLVRDDSSFSSVDEPRHRVVRNWSCAA
jgi:hypothetical protein